jgi:cobalamin biosynthesis protein CobD/CbiB
MHKLTIIALLTAACSAYLLFSCIFTAVKIGNIDGIAKAKHAGKLKEAREIISMDMSRNQRAFTEEYGKKARQLEEEKKRLRELKSGTAGKEKTTRPD